MSGIPLPPASPLVGPGMAYTVRKTANKVFTLFNAPSGVVNTQKLINLRTFPLMLPLMAMGLIVHSKAQENAENKYGPKREWLKIIAESTLATFLINATTGVYPLLCFGKGVYEAGESKDVLGKLQAIAKNMVIFLAGFIGVQGATGFFVEGPIEMEEGEMRRFLSTPKLLDRLTDTANPKEVRELGNALKELLTKLNTLDQKYQPNANIELSEIKLLKQELVALKEKAWGLFTPLKASDTLKKLFPRSLDLTTPFNQFIYRLESSQQGYIQLARQITPVCSFLIATSLVGIPIAKWVCHKMEEWFPQLRKQDFPEIEVPEDPLIPSGMHPFKIFSTLGGHGGGHHPGDSGPFSYNISGHGGGGH